MPRLRSGHQSPKPAALTTQQWQAELVRGEAVAPLVSTQPALPVSPNPALRNASSGNVLSNTPASLVPLAAITCLLFGLAPILAAFRVSLNDTLKEGGAHAMFEDAIKDFPASLRHQKVSNFPHSAWMLLEHMRIAQRDILEFSRNPKHKSPKWPEGYWPKSDAPPTASALTKSRNVGGACRTCVA